MLLLGVISLEPLAITRHYHRSYLEQKVHGTDVTHRVTLELLSTVLLLVLLS